MVHRRWNSSAYSPEGPFTAAWLPIGECEQANCCGAQRSDDLSAVLVQGELLMERVQRALVIIDGDGVQLVDWVPAIPVGGNSDDAT
jgi:hypothetical protein